MTHYEAGYNFFTPAYRVHFKVEEYLRQNKTSQHLYWWFENDVPVGWQIFTACVVGLILSPAWIPFGILQYVFGHIAYAWHTLWDELHDDLPKDHGHWSAAVVTIILWLMFALYFPTIGISIILVFLIVGGSLYCYTAIGD